MELARAESARPPRVTQLCGRICAGRVRMELCVSRRSAACGCGSPEGLWGLLPLRDVGREDARTGVRRGRRHGWRLQPRHPQHHRRCTPSIAATARNATFAPAAAWFLDQSRWNSTISEGNLDRADGSTPPRAQPPRGLAAAAIRGRRGRRASGNVSARAVAGAPSCLPLPQGASHTAQQQRHKSTGSACAAPRQLAAARARPRP